MPGEAEQSRHMPKARPDYMQMTSRKIPMSDIDPFIPHPTPSRGTPAQPSDPTHLCLTRHGGEKSAEVELGCLQELDFADVDLSFYQ